MRASSSSPVACRLVQGRRWLWSGALAVALPAAAATAPTTTAPTTTAPTTTAPTTTAPTTTAPTTTAPTTTAIPFTKYTLKNGLEVILHEDHRQPTVAVDVWYHVAAHEEVVGRTGFAHLFEHLMFQGSAHVGADQHIRLLEEAGAADLNGTTDFDRTNYYETVPKHELELALWLEADRMGWLMESVTQATLDEQRGVVKNERRESTEGQPYGLAEEKLWQAVFPAEHPYRGGVIGSQADLDKASLADVRRFFDDHYAPSNATLCIAGDIDPTAARQLVEKYFGSLPAWPRPPRRTIPVPPLATEVRVEHEETVGALPLVELLWLTPGRGQPGYRELDILAAVLGDGIASKLQDALIVQAPLAQNVVVVQRGLREASTFIIRVVVRPGVAVDDVLNTIQAQLDVLNDLPITAEEVQRVVRRLETEAVFELQTPLGRAEVLQDGNHFDGDPGAYAVDLDKLRNVTAEGVMAAFKAHLPRDRRAVLVARPAPATPPGAAATTSTTASPTAPATTSTTASPTAPATTSTAAPPTKGKP
jgi:predicted Zn-dependent peptidase